MKWSVAIPKTTSLEVLNYSGYLISRCYLSADRQAFEMTGLTFVLHKQALQHNKNETVIVSARVAIQIIQPTISTNVSNTFCNLNFMERHTLFKFDSPTISIHVKTYFEEGNLKVDGYDIGKAVKGMMGSSDYEYEITVKSEDLDELYKALGLSNPDRHLLLSKITSTYNTNTCWSDFLRFLESNNIKHEVFTWR